MPIPFNEKNSGLKDKAEEALTSKSSSAAKPASPNNSIVETSNMAGLTLAPRRQGEVQEHDSFEHRGLRPKLVAATLSQVAILPKKHVVGQNSGHGGGAGSEFPNKNDATSTVSSHHSKPKPYQYSTSLPPAGHLQPQTSRSKSSSVSLTPQQAYRKLPSSSLSAAAASSVTKHQQPNFASLFAAARNNKLQEQQPQQQQQQEDTMSVEKVLPDQQVKSAKKARRKRTPQQQQRGQTSGRWTNQEHQAFLDGLQEFGREWKKVATRIPTRTSAQIRSHAQKYFSKLQREQETIQNLTSPADQGLMMMDHSSSQEDQPKQQAQPPHSIAPSVQKNIERLIADPQAVQREVEHTLRALQERYRQLQAQLQQRQQQQQPQNLLGGPRKPMLLQPPPPVVAAEEEEEEASSTGSRKRSYQDMETSTVASSQQEQEQQKQEASSDDQSSVTTNISASVASLDNEELIALHVLGGALPRNESNTSIADLFAVASVSRRQDSSAPASPASPQSNAIVDASMSSSPKDHKK